MIAVIAQAIAWHPVRSFWRAMALVVAGSAVHYGAAAQAGGVFGYQPRYPGDPFGTPWLVLCDSCRLLCFACAGVLLIGLMTKLRITPAEWLVTVRGRKVPTHLSWSRLRMIAEMGAAWVVCETEIDHLGYGVGVGGRLWISTGAMVIFGAMGVRRVVRPMASPIG